MSLDIEAIPKYSVQRKHMPSPSDPQTSVGHSLLSANCGTALAPYRALKGLAPADLQTPLLCHSPSTHTAQR